MSKKDKLKKSTGKSKNTVMIVVVVVLVILVFLYLRSGDSGEVGANDRTSVTAIPDVQNVPGGSQVSANYARAINQSNKVNAQRAQSLGQNFVATVDNTGFGQSKNQKCTEKCCACKVKTLKSTLANWLSTGKLSKQTAAALGELNKKNLSVSDYADALQRLVKAGKLTPEQARELLAKYKKEHGDDIAKAGAKEMDALIKSGKLPLSAANALLNLQKNGASVDDYAQALAKLVKEGKISKATAAKLLAEYKKKHGGLQTVSLDNLIKHGLPGSFSAGSFNNQNLANPNAMSGALPNARNFSGMQAKPVMQDSQVGGEPMSSEEAALLAARKQEIEALSASMKTQATSIIKGNATPTQVAMVAQVPKTAADSGVSGSESAKNAKESENGQNTNHQAPPFVKAGDIQFAVLDTAVNSDYASSPVMATIVQGKLKGGKLIGKLSRGGNNNNDRVILTFDLLNMPNWSKSVPVKAVAIAPETARSALATSVNHHYLSRYSSLFASAFLAGYGQTFSQAGQIIVAGGGTDSKGNLPVITTGALSPKQRIFAGLGKVGEQTSSAAEQYFNTPPTVRVKSGVGLGILFLGSVSKVDTTVKHNNKKGQ